MPCGLQGFTWEFFFPTHENNFLQKNPAHTSQPIWFFKQVHGLQLSHISSILYKSWRGHEQQFYKIKQCCIWII